MRLLACLAIALAGCATVPEPEIRTVTVDKPIPVPCRVAMPEEPAWAMDAIAPDADIDTLMAAAIAELEQRVGYEIRLKAAIATCKAPIALDREVPR
jgi:hypothetical protein